MAAAQRGDADAYALLLHSIAPRLRRLIRRRRGFAGNAAVEDIVQDVLLSLHAVRATYDPARPFVPWLMAIVRHRLADHARHHARREAHELPLERMDVTSAAVAPKFVEGGPWEIDALTRAIRVLPRSQREAITLLKLQELSLKDASAITGLTVGALKVATHRAMATLRRVLGRSLR